MTISVGTKTSLWIAAAVVAAVAGWSALQAVRRGAPAPAVEAPRNATRPRIVALVAGVVDTLDALGELDCLVATGGPASDYPGTENKARILADERGGMTNAEAILALKPDYVLVARELAPSLEGRGLNVVRVPQDDFPHLHEFVLQVGGMVGARDRAQACLDHMDAKVAEIRRKVAGLRPVRVYWEAGAMGQTFGPGTAVHEMIQLAGGENIYQDARIPRPTLGVESIMAADPEVIVLSFYSASPDEVMARPGWDLITAVRTKRVYRVSSEDRAVALYTPRCADACERTFLRWFHPELFRREERR